MAGGSFRIPEEVRSRIGAVPEFGELTAGAADVPFAAGVGDVASGAVVGAAAGGGGLMGPFCCAASGNNATPLAKISAEIDAHRKNRVRVSALIYFRSPSGSSLSDRSATKGNRVAWKGWWKNGVQVTKFPDSTSA